MRSRANRGMVILGGVAFVCLVCAIGAVVISRMSILQFVGNNPKSAQKVANSIVDFTLPEGYQTQGSLNLGIFKMVFITPDGMEPQVHARPVILLAAFPSTVDIPADKVRLELQLAMLRNSDELSTMEFVREEKSIIRDKNVTFEVYESFGSYDPPTRMVFSSLFSGKSDQVMLMVAGPIDTWDQPLMEQFIGSIR